jgi:hypothetical protein
MGKSKKMPENFFAIAEKLRTLQLTNRVNKLGGYGASGEVIYDAPPPNCPSVLLSNLNDATLTVMSNGSVKFTVKNQRDLEVTVLHGSFDPVAKQETGVPSSNVWLEMNRGKKQCFTSLINPNIGQGLTPSWTRIVKLGDPERSMWFMSEFSPSSGVKLFTAVRYMLKTTNVGPVLCRDVVVKNIGRKKAEARIWSWFELHGTQKMYYDKPIWYDAGLPVSLTESVITESTPKEDYIQIKRVSTELINAKALDATCDYADFVGNSSATALLPEAVRRGAFLKAGAGSKWNRFITPVGAANSFLLFLKPGKQAAIRQTLLYITDKKLIAGFYKTSACKIPTYEGLATQYKKASLELIRRTPGAKKINSDKGAGKKTLTLKAFELTLPHQPIVAFYANSSWTGVDDIYENCRSHGAVLADGIEVGTRDRGQDMWPKMKEDPGRVRSDLVHVLSLMFQTCKKTPVAGRKPLTLVEKLHGMFPRQYPSVWRNRSIEVANDNRPYSDSPLWLINSLYKYLKETGDASILDEKVKSVRLTNPKDPWNSNIIGCENTFTVLQVVFEIIANFERQIKDSPYGLPQILGGDWCDPVDMFGTSKVGDYDSLGYGRGAQIRLAGHLFETLIQVLDLLKIEAVYKRTKILGLANKADTLRITVNKLRESALKFAWEDGAEGFNAGFIDSIHELTVTGKKPDYKNGETGYTLGSMKGKDPDGEKRRVLPSNAYGLLFLLIKRDYLAPLPCGDEMLKKLLLTTNKIFYSPLIGLKLFSRSVASIHRNGELFGRISSTQPGCSENGEYHHGQMFMHYFRMQVPGEADTAWQHFKPMLSALKDEKIGGPFETSCCSYQAEEKDPHFGQGMYFGLSGTVDWMIDFFQNVAGIEMDLLDPSKPDLSFNPKLPSELKDELTYKRIVHQRSGNTYKKIPLTLTITRKGSGKTLINTLTTVNGKSMPAPEIQNISGYKELNVNLTRIYN